MTTLAPVPGSNGGPGDAGDANAGANAAAGEPQAAPPATVDLTGQKVKLAGKDRMMEILNKYR